MLPDPIYQASIQSSANEWRQLYIPFNRFQAIYMGYPRELQKELDSFSLRALAVMIADRAPGPFRIDVRLIKAVPRQA